VLDVDAMCASSWHWQSENIDGYGDGAPR